MLVGAADGDLSDDEAMVALERLTNHDTLSKAFTPTQIEAAFDKQAKRAKTGLSGRLSLRKEVEEAREKSAFDDLEMLMVICCDVAQADGDVGAKEMGQLKVIGQAVGIDPARYLA